MNGIKLTVHADTSGAARDAVALALKVAFPSGDDGLVWINAATDGRAFAEAVARVAWEANGGYCTLVVEIDWSAALPDGVRESIEFTPTEFNRLMARGPEDAIVVSEHWPDLNDAALAAARTLAEISKRYPCTAFEAVVIGCEEYPYVSAGAPRRADPQMARIQAFGGRFECRRLPEWSEIRAEVERAKSKKEGSDG